jgi:hypothetical protein
VRYSVRPVNASHSSTYRFAHETTARLRGSLNCMRPGSMTAECVLGIILCAGLVLPTAGRVEAAVVEHPSWRALRPPARAGSGLVLETRRRRAIVLGGSACVGPRGPEVWAMPADSAWRVERLVTRGLDPEPMEFLAAVYDSLEDRILVVGGASGNRLWQLALGDTSVWSELPPTGDVPPAGYRPAIAYDPVRQRFIVTGIVPDETQARTWIVEPGARAQWSLVETRGEAPTATFQAVMTHDPVLDRALLYGAGSDVLRSLDLSSSAPTWSIVAATGSQRAPAVTGGLGWFDADRRRLLVRAGDAVGSVDDRTWEFVFLDSHAGEWRPLAETGSRPRFAWRSASTYDERHRRWLVYGGFSFAGSGCLALGDLRALDVATGSWTDLLPGVSEPFEMSGLTALHDEARQRVLLYPGRARLGDAPAGPMLIAPLGEPLRWTASSSVLRPPHAFGGVVLVDSTADRILLLGGFPWSDRDDRLWAYALASDEWAPVSATGTAPAARGAAGAVIDPFHHRLLLFGGFTLDEPRDPAGSNDLWELDLTRTPPQWRPIHFEGGPGPRAGAAMAIDRKRRRALLFGGSTGNLGLRDVWALDLDSLTWSRPSVPPVPFNLHARNVVEAPEEDALYAIAASSTGYTVQRCDLATLVWTDLRAVSGPPIALTFGLSAIRDRERGRVYAFDGSHTVPEPWVLELDTPGHLTIAHLETRIDAAAREAKIWWRSVDLAVGGATLERSIDGSEWSSSGRVVAYGGGLMSHVERGLVSGAAYRFRLRIDSVTPPRYTGAVEFVAPVVPSASLTIYPNPAPGRWNVRYRLSDGVSGADRLELFDLAGRKWLDQRLTAGAGSGELSFGPELRLKAGLYFLRLMRGSESRAVASIVIVR